MANQIYGYNPSTYGGSGGLSSVYPSSSSYLSDPSLIGSGASRYLASSDPLAPSEASKYSSLFQTDAYRYPGSEYSAGIGDRYPGSEYGAGGGGYASRIGPPGVGVGAGGGYGLVSHNSWPLPGTELGPTGYDPSIGAGIKRPSEALYHQTVLGTHNTIGQSEAFYSTNTLAKRPRFETATSLPVYPQREGQDCAHYMLTRTCKFGEACKFHHPTWVPEGGIPDWKEVPLVAVSEALPERPGEPDCPYFLKTQKCKFGVRCKFNHPKDKIETTMNEVEPVDVALLPDRPSEPPCAFYLKTGKCKFGVSCKFHHPKDIQVPPTTQENGNKEQNESAAKDDGTTTGDVKAGKPFVPFTAALLHNSKGLPIRPGEVDCPFYLKTGSCKYGATCRYNHPERTTINPPVAAGLGPAVIPSPAVNMSMGIIHPAAPVHPSIDPRLAPQPTLGLGTSLYPQRPGQTYCDFYMKTGECKFGERCKFHHPIDRSAPTLVAKQAVPNVKLTLAGFPRREGSVICPFYMKTGTCKYGATCKFDHPPPGEAIAMATVQGTAASVGGEAEGKATESNQEQEQ